MFTVGDVVVHPKHGSGVVSMLRTIEYRGDQREYFCIELAAGRGSVMIPVERLTEAGLRKPIRDTRLIQQVMGTTPETLVDDTHVRHSGIEGKISSGSIELLIEALRDLCWRETVQHLSPTDKNLKEAALSKILQELSLNPLLVMSTIKQNVDTIIRLAMEMHLRNLESSSPEEDGASDTDEPATVK